MLELVTFPDGLAIMYDWQGVVFCVGTLQYVTDYATKCGRQWLKS